MNNYIKNPLDLQVVNINLESHFQENGIEFEIKNNHINMKCPIGNHSNDKKGSFGFGLDIKSKLGKCFKCNYSCNIISLCKDLEIPLPIEIRSLYTNKAPDYMSKKKSLDTLRLEYLKSRGLSESVIEIAGFSEIKHQNSAYISLPVFDIKGNFIGNKLREFPNLGKNKKWEQKGASAQLFGTHLLKKIPHREDIIVLTEGELDSLSVLSQGIFSVSTTGGAMTWRDEWSIWVVENFKNIYIAYDNDETGIKGSLKVAEALWKLGKSNTHIILIPNSDGIKDVGDWIMNHTSMTELIENHSEIFPPKTSKEGHTEFGVSEVIEVLNHIIKRDDITKTTLFIGLLGVFTEKHCINFAMNGQSSSGKTFIVKNILSLFPENTLLEFGNASKKAFIHLSGDYDPETNTTRIDFQNRIISIGDAPSFELLETLRSFLSQDKKEITYAITDKSASGSQSTKKITLIGYASMILSSASLSRDEQEATRVLTLSPEVSREKSEIAIHHKLNEAENHINFLKNTELHPVIELLKKRVLSIKYLNIKHVDIPEREYLEKVFTENTKNLLPRHSRDFHRYKALIAGFTLLNHFWRKRLESDDQVLLATRFDIDQATILWKVLSEPQELGITPNNLELYRKVILPCYLSPKNSDGRIKGVTRKQVKAKYYEIYNTQLADKYLDNQLLSQLEATGMIEILKDESDRRNKLIYPIYENQEQEEYIPRGVGVENEENLKAVDTVKNETITYHNGNYTEETDAGYGINS